MADVGTDSQQGLNGPGMAINRVPPQLEPYRFKVGHAPTPGAGRKPRPASLKKRLPWALEELYKLAEQNEDIDIKYKAVHDIIAWNIGRPGSELFDEDPEDMKALFNEVLDAYDWEVVKKIRPIQGVANDKDRMSDADAITGGLRDGAGGPSE